MTFLSSFSKSAWLVATALVAPMAHGEALDWRSIEWNSVDYFRIPVEGGAALYTLPSPSEKRFRLDFTFRDSAMAFPFEQLPTFRAAVTLLLQGGAGSRSFEEIQKLTTENAIKIAAVLTPDLRLQVTAEGLTGDFEKTLALVEDVLLRPRFDKSAFPIWKQQTLARYQSQLDADSPQEQIAFATVAAHRFVFGEKSYLGQGFTREKPALIEGIAPDQLSKAASLLINRAGLNIVLSGNFTTDQQDKTLKLAQKLPKVAPRGFLWEPERPLLSPDPKTKVIVIRKKDMQQCWVDHRLFAPLAGELSRIENTYHTLAMEVFSSSLGVVGNDRWSKAMRADSGFSYSASAYFMERFNAPNTNMGLYRLVSQSPNDRIDEALELAQKTWDEFARKGVTAEEWKRVLPSIINSELNSEETIFQKARTLSALLQEGRMLPPTPTENRLAQFEVSQSVEKANTFIKALAGDKLVKVVVVIGNPDDAKIKKLAKSPHFEIIKTVDFETFAKAL